MRLVYVALDPETIEALVRLAKANRRHPKHEGALIIERYLQEQGLLSRYGQTPDAALSPSVAPSGADQQPPTSGGGAT